MEKKMRRYFITGLIVLLPVFLTVYILSITIHFADNILGRFINQYFAHKFGVTFFGVGILSIIILIFATGILATNVFIKKIIPWLEHWFLQIPFVRQIYPPIKQLTGFLFSEEKTAFKKVVIFEYPRKGIYTLGFVTNEFFMSNISEEKIESVCVYIASAPNPVTGFFVISARKDVLFLDITIEEAFRIIVSGGVLMPHNLFIDKTNLTNNNST